VTSPHASVLTVCAWVSSLALASLSAGCEPATGVSPEPPSASGRSVAVTAKQAASAAPTGSAGAPKVARKLCDKRLGRSPPASASAKGALKGRAAAGKSAPAEPAYGVGKWTWINLWAAWCGPCKEELPRLFAWQKKLKDEGISLDLVFVSLDDDERQLDRFLEQQPAAGLKASHWLPEGEGRATWLRELGVRETPELPVQGLVAPSGKLECLVQGAVEDVDYPAILAFLRAEK
jgi:thiol-disulfide isomerase/thioredoxin